MKNRSLLIALVLLIFFVISFLTNILGALNPAIKGSFNLEFSSLGFMTLAFFSAYGIMSIPAGILVEKYKEKKVLLFAFVLSFIGATAFAFIPTFVVFLGSLFLIGTGMAMLQVAINPLLRTAGREENFAFYSVLGQLFFGAAGVAGPYFYSYLVEKKNEDTELLNIKAILNSLVPKDMSWVSIYVLFACISLIMVVIIFTCKFPKVELKEDEKTEDWRIIKELIKNKIIIAYFVGIFCYVGFEQGVSFWISQFLETYHQVNPETIGAETVGNFWGLLTLGCFLGLILLKFVDSKLVLKTFSVMAFISLAMALFGSKEISLLAFPAVGFFASVMWSIIVSLALNSVKHNHGSLTGILCTGIVGGAIAPFIVGYLSDLFSLKIGMFFNFLTLSYILGIGIWANPLVKNKTFLSRINNSKKSVPASPIV